MKSLDLVVIRNAEGVMRFMRVEFDGKHRTDIGTWHIEERPDGALVRVLRFTQDDLDKMFGRVSLWQWIMKRWLV